MKTKIIMQATCLILTVSFALTALAQEEFVITSVCYRTDFVKEQILKKTEKKNCEDVTQEELNAIKVLDFYKAYRETELKTYGVGFKTGDFSGLFSLEILNLSVQGIKSLPSDIFSGLFNLKNLELDSNEFTYFPPGLFSDLVALEVLSIKGNDDLEGLPENIFSNLHNLRELKMNGLYSRTHLPANIFNGLSNLEELNLHGGVLNSLPLGIFSGLPNLRVIELNWQRKLTYFPPGLFSDLISLETLGLYNTPIAVHRLYNEELKHLPNFKELIYGSGGSARSLP